MEAGYNSSRLGPEGHYGEDNLYNQSGPYIVSTPSYYFNNSPPVKSNLKGDNQPLEMCTEGNLARRLMILTNSLNQGKPIRVDDLLSLRSDQTEILHFLADTNAPHGQGNFDAHAVYAGDDAVSSHGRWSQLATAGVRNALSALISYYGLDNVYNPAAAISRLPPASDMKTHCSPEKVPSEYSQKLEISTSHHVETTFLPDGRKLKQSRLIFHPIKCNKKIISLSAHKRKLASILPKVEQESIEDISAAKASTATESNVADTNETFDDVIEISPMRRNIMSEIMESNIADTNETFEDVIEISPTQRNIMSKVTHRLKLKRKTSAKETIKSSSSKYHDPVSSVAPEIMIDTMDFALCPSPEHTSVAMKDDKPLVGNMTNTVVNALKDKVNVNNFSPVKMYNNVQIKKEDQSIVNKVQNIAEKKNVFTYEDESFYLPAKLALNKNDTDDFNLDDTENKPPVKKASLAKFDILSKRKEVVSEQLNMRCKADRAKLSGWDCWECEEYYKNLSLSKDELQKRKNQCSRHRHKYERPNTPEGFWDPEFPETLSSTYRQNKT
ncbi:retinoblastoma-binding protein 8 [Lasius niger]|uniref:Retinoblastoma-binding protein 8 n=1 Tax=Lasius niger TaxID=67767 RepID=A0A0J7L5H7_LASNI|nr:retinoblastoma-binding protein 8 [Lasius niger]